MRHSLKFTKKAASEQWFPLGIGLGVVLAVGLLANSVANYVFLSQRVQVDQLRRDVAEQVARLDADLQSTPNQSHLPAVLGRAQSRAGGRLAWIALRDTNDALLARTGLDVPASFTAEQVRAQLRARKSAFTTRKTEQGEVVVEAFVLRLPATGQTVRFQPASYAAPATRPVALLEVGARLDGTDGRLWPLRRNLLINCSGAIALLATLLVIRARFRSYLAGQRLEQEVELARRVQQDLLPAPRDTSATFELAADFAPAADLGGDFYDAFPLSGTNGVGAAFVLGDVSGKGIPAALLTGVIHGAVRSSAWTESARQHRQATEQLNRLLSERASSERFASLFWGYCEGGTLRYINAGHLAPILMRGNRPTCLRLDEGGPVLGLLPGAKFETGSVELEPDDLLVLYSDGLVEAVNQQDEQFGEERVLALVQQHRHLSATQLRDRILRAAQAFTGNAELEDDRTLLVLRYTGAAARAQVVGARETIHT
jgi:serine phosphatase RsbU (regulator of sigma subunit)